MCEPPNVLSDVFQVAINYNSLQIGDMALEIPPADTTIPVNGPWGGRVRVWVEVGRAYLPSHALTLAPPSPSHQHNHHSHLHPQLHTHTSTTLTLTHTSTTLTLTHTSTTLTLTHTCTTSHLTHTWSSLLRLSDISTIRTMRDMGIASTKSATPTQYWKKSSDLNLLRQMGGHS